MYNRITPRTTRFDFDRRQSYTVTPDNAVGPTTSLTLRTVMAHSDLNCVYVAMNGDDINNNGSQADPFRTIQNAINNIGSKSLITVIRNEYVGDLIFQEQLQLNKNLTIQVELGETAEIIYPDTYSPTSFAGGGEIFNNKLFGVSGTNIGYVDNNWNYQVVFTTSSRILDLKVFNNEIYCLTTSKVYKSSTGLSGSWSEIYNLGITDYSNNTGNLFIHSNELYFCYGWNSGGSSVTNRLYKMTGTNWNLKYELGTAEGNVIDSGNSVEGKIIIREDYSIHYSEDNGNTFIIKNIPAFTNLKQGILNYESKWYGGVFNLKGLYKYNEKDIVFDKFTTGNNELDNAYIGGITEYFGNYYITGNIGTTIYLWKTFDFTVFETLISSFYYYGGIGYNIVFNDILLSNGGSSMGLNGNLITSNNFSLTLNGFTLNGNNKKGLKVIGNIGPVDFLWCETKDFYSDIFDYNSKVVNGVRYSKFYNTKKGINYNNDDELDYCSFYGFEEYAINSLSGDLNLCKNNTIVNSKYGIKGINLGGKQLKNNIFSQNTFDVYNESNSTCELFNSVYQNVVNCIVNNNTNIKAFPRFKNPPDDLNLITRENTTTAPYKPIDWDSVGKYLGDDNKDAGCYSITRVKSLNSYNYSYTFDYEPKELKINSIRENKNEFKSETGEIYISFSAITNKWTLNWSNQTYSDKTQYKILQRLLKEKDVINFYPMIDIQTKNPISKLEEYNINQGIVDFDNLIITLTNVNNFIDDELSKWIICIDNTYYYKIKTNYLDTTDTILEIEDIEGYNLTGAETLSISILYAQIKIINNDISVNTSLYDGESLENVYNEYSLELQLV